MKDELLENYKKRLPNTLTVYGIKNKQGQKESAIHMCGKWLSWVCGFKAGEIVKIDRKFGEIIIRKRG